MLKSLLILGFLCCACATPVFAKEKLNAEISRKTRDLNKVKEELTKKREEKERLKKEAENLSASLKSGEESIRNVEKSLLFTRQKNSEVVQQLATTKNKHDRVARTFENESDRFNRSVSNYFLASAMKGRFDVSSVYSRQIIHQRAALLGELEEKKKQTQRNLTTLIDTQVVLRGEVRQQESQLSNSVVKYKEKEKLLSKKMNQQETLESELRDLRRTAEELGSLIDLLRSKAKEEQISEKNARLEKQKSGHSPVPANSLPWPTPGKIVTRFGRQQQPGSGTNFISNGVVIGGVQVGPVTAVADGKVLYAGDFMSYGSMAVVEHPGDWYTVYGRLSRWSVEKGQEINKGDVVGFSRPVSGGGTECYFEIRFYGKPTDPLPWMTK